MLIYKITKGFPKEEIFNLVSQMRRAAYSIPSNIAEGSGRGTQKDFIRFIQIAQGSANEFSYFCFLSKDLKYLESADYDDINGKCIEVSKMLNGLINKKSDLLTY